MSAVESLIDEQLAADEFADSGRDVPAEIRSWVAGKVAEGVVWRGDAMQKPYLWNRISGRPIAREMLESLAVNDLGLRYLSADSRKEAMGVLFNEVSYGIPVIFGTTFVPGGERIIREGGLDVLNTFEPMVNSALCEIPKPFIKLLQHVFPDRYDRKWMLGWLAHMVQKPEERPSIHPIVRKEMGTGLGLLMKTMRDVLNGMYKRVTDLRQITDKNSNALYQNILCFADESKSYGMETTIKLRAVEGDDDFAYRALYEMPRMERTYTRFLYSGNDKGVLFPLGDADRRHYVCRYNDHLISREESRAFGAEYDLQRPGLISDIRDWLLGLEVTWNGHDVTATETEAKAEYMAMGMNGLSGAVTEYPYDVLTERLWNIWAALRGCRDYQELMKDAGAHFESKLFSAGFGKKKRPKNREGKKIAVYIRGKLSGQAVHDAVAAAETDILPKKPVEGEDLLVNLENPPVDEVVELVVDDAGKVDLSASEYSI